MNYYMSKKIKRSFEEAVQLVIEGLKAEGFGVVSEINMNEKLKEKLAVDFRKYKILGACNPSYAYEALLEEDKIGVILPCNVIIQELSEGVIEVAAVNPVASMSSIDNSKLMKIALNVQQKLKSVIEKLK